MKNKRNLPLNLTNESKQLCFMFHNRLIYNPKNPQCPFAYRKSTSGIYAGSIGGTLGDRGYWKIKIDGKLYRVHRLVFFYFNGYCPNEIDHIDENKSNNLIENLRGITHSENIKKSIRFKKINSGNLDR